MLSAGSWLLSRIAETKRITNGDVICLRFGKSAEIAVHQLWECNWNMLVEHDDVQITKRYARETVQGSVDNPTHCLRGILYCAMIEIQTYFPDYLLRCTYCSLAEWGSGVWFGDGSVGHFSS